MKTVAIFTAFLAGAAMAVPVQEPGEICLRIIVYPGMECPEGTVRKVFDPTSEDQAATCCLPKKD